MRYLRSIFIIFFIFVSFFSAFQINAATVESVNQQISDTNAQIQALDKEIARYQTEIDTTSQQSNTLANLIKQLTLTRNKLLTETKSTQKKITATGLVINTLNTNIEEKQKSIALAKEVLAKMFRDLYERDSITIVGQVLANASLSEASQYYTSVQSFNAKVRANIEDLKGEEDSLAQSKTQKVADQKNLTTLQQSLIQKKLAVDAAKAAKDLLLTDTKSKESNYKKLLADSQAKRDKFESDLQSYEAALKFILNPSSLPTAGTGVLSWPLDKVFITQLFGKTVAAKRLYVSGSHSGVDFRASLGTPVKSMADGTVLGSGNTDDYCKGASFGKWVFIKYNNGLSSTYGHLSVIEATAGQSVHTGDIVGLSGNTGHSTGPHLHVTVYASEGASVKTVPSLSCSGHTFIMPIAPTSAYLDPMVYLPKISSSQIKNDISKD